MEGTMKGAQIPVKVPLLTLASGAKIPSIGMGTFGSDHNSPGEVSAAVAGALRVGYRLFDCAAVYGNEENIGKVFAEAFASGLLRREDLFISSKVWNDMHGKGDVLLALAKTLRDLQLEYVDAYFVHWPFPNFHAPGCDGDARNPASKPFSPEAFMRVWGEMEKIHRMGLAKHIGMSNMTIPKMEAVLPLCEIKPALIEMEMHPAFQQRELFEYCLKRKIQPIGYCPIGSPNRPDRDKAPGDIIDTEMPEIEAVASAHNIHPALVCLKWQVRIGSIPIPMSVNERNYTANLRCVAEAPLTDAEMASIAGADKNCRLVKGQVFLWPGAKSWEDLWDINGTITK
jgi:alcohol dehydrogenase (NADP+)